MGKRQALWLSYVYALTKDGQILYIGKGTSRRLAQQRRNFGLDGHELAWFKTEQDAYAFERIAISEYQPWLNRHPGGNGSWAIPKPVPKIHKDADTRLMERIGTRAFAARILLSCKDKGLVTMDERSEIIFQAIGYGVRWIENNGAFNAV